jgi:uncharacterized membrane protein
LVLGDVGGTALVNVGAEVTVIPRKELAAEVEPSAVVRAFVMPVAVEPTGTVTRAVMITEPAATWTTTKDGGTWRGEVGEDERGDVEVE